MKDTVTMPDDGSKPLPNHQQEQFAQSVAQGMSYYTAYSTAGFAAKNRNSADVAASRLAARPEVAERIAWLKVRAASGAAMTRAEKITALETIIRTGSGADKIKAIAAHTDLIGDNNRDAEYAPDPAKLADLRQRQNAAIVSACGRDGTAWATIICADGVRELSGSAAEVATKLAEVARSLMAQKH